jgi:hypothetical protein
LTGLDGANGMFGAVASAGDVNGDGFADLIVGAFGVGGNTGRAYLYLGGPGGASGTPSATLSGLDGTNATFGRVVSSAGDVNGDGYADVIVGAGAAAPMWVGRAYIYLGGPTGIATVPAVGLTGANEPYAMFGSAVAEAGDVNGDGYDDVAVGAQQSPSNTGVFIYYGGPTGCTNSPGRALTGPDAPDGNFGYSVAGAGDVNGDGLADLVVGAWSVNSNAGRVYVYLGGALGIASSPSRTLIGPDMPGWSFGWSVSAAGDFNGDGYGDIGIGALGADMFTGRVELYLGSAAGIPGAPASVRISPDGAGSRFGFVTANIGDIDGDGLSDVGVSTYGDATVPAVSARVYVLFGGPGGRMSAPLTGSDDNNMTFGGYLALISRVRPTRRAWLLRPFCLQDG